MKITAFRIENFRNIRLAQCDDVPDFVVVCGGNGCGKSALLEALMTAKETIETYGNFTFDPKAVSADADKATISMRLSFSADERAFCHRTFSLKCPTQHEVVIEIAKNGTRSNQNNNSGVQRLLGHYRRAVDQPGFFDFINAHRQVTKQSLQ